MSKIQYTYRPAQGDRRHFIDRDDVRVVLSRLPQDLLKRVKAVHFRDWNRFRPAGYANRTGRREVLLCAMPPRVSLSGYLRRTENPGMFGAVRGCAWPVLAVRRFMLYDVLLHEIGRLQIVDENAGSDRRKFAGETLAQDFAELWRARLWSEHFDHPDAVHNPPRAEELEMVRAGWKEAHEQYKLGLRAEGEEPSAALEHYTEAINLCPEHNWALEAAAELLFKIGHDPERVAQLLHRALAVDPTSPTARAALLRVRDAAADTA